MPPRFGSARIKAPSDGTIPVKSAPIESIRIETSGTAILAAGGFVFSLPITRYAEAGCDIAALRGGDVLDSAAIEALLDSQRRYDCFREGLQLSSRAEHSVAMLEAKLDSRGYARAEIAETIGKLRDAGFVDDRRFAAAWIAHRCSTRAEGPDSLLSGLLKRGVSNEDAREAVRVALPEGIRHDCLLEAARRLERRGMKADRVAVQLRRLGFRRGEILEAGIAEKRDGDTSENLDQDFPG